MATALKEAPEKINQHIYDRFEDSKYEPKDVVGKFWQVKIYEIKDGELLDQETLVKFFPRSSGA